MIVVTGTARIREGQREAFVVAATPMIEATRLEDGVSECRYAFDLLDPDVVTFHEEFADEDALQAHFKTPHLGAFYEAGGPLMEGRPTVTKWVAEKAPMG